MLDILVGLFFWGWKQWRSHRKLKGGCDCGAYIRVVDSLARNCGLKKKKTFMNMLTVMFRLKENLFGICIYILWVFLV